MTERSIDQERCRQPVARVVRQPELTHLLPHRTCEDLHVKKKMMPVGELERERDANEDVSCFCGD